MRRGALAIAVLLVALVPLGVRAGDRPLELLLGDMSPDGSRPDCIRDLVREIRHRDRATGEEVNLSRMGEGGIRRLVGHDDESSFLSWTVEDLRPIMERRRETPLDAVALVDCRAVEGEVEMLVLSPAGGLLRMSLRRTAIDEERARWLGRTLLHHAWTGFSP